MKKPLVLVVEDNQMMLTASMLILEGDTTVLTARSFHRARVLMKEHGAAIVGITLDYNIQLYEDDTSSRALGRDLIYYIRKECGGIPVYASSANKDKNVELVSLSCLEAGKADSAVKLCEYVESLKHQ